MGAVYMGALTYIGDATNLMVYAIAQERGIKMPNFFVHAVAGAVLVPLCAAYAPSNSPYFEVDLTRSNHAILNFETGSYSGYSAPQYRGRGERWTGAASFSA
jgi:Putative citrate transport